MRVLLDESLPRPLGRLLTGHDVRTVAQEGWTSFENGQLLRASAERFDVLVTADQNLEYQQNATTLPIAVIVLIAESNPVGIGDGKSPQPLLHERQLLYE